MWNILYSYLSTHKILTELAASNRLTPPAGNISNYVYKTDVPTPALGGVTQIQNLYSKKK